MLEFLRQRGLAYIRFASPMLIAGIGLFWLLELGIVAWRFWPNLSSIGAPPLYTPNCHNAQCDFAMFWPAGWAARAHQFAMLYQPLELLTISRHFLGEAAHCCLVYAYPPPALLLSLPISLIPFNAAALVWITALTSLSTLLLRWAGLSWAVTLAILLCPATLWNYECMQISLLAASLLIAGLMRMNNAPWRAGLLLGLLVIKPQIGLLAGVALLATGRYRTLAAALLSAGGVCALITALLGPDVWRAFVTYGLPAAASLLDAKLVLHSYEAYGVSVFWMVRSLGGTIALSRLLQGLSTLAVAALCWRIWRGNAPMAQKLAVTGWSALLATPYGFTYDLIAASAGLAALIEARRWRIGLMESVFWASPIISPYVANTTSLELAPLITILALGWCWHAAPREPVPHRGIIPV